MPNSYSSESTTEAAASRASAAASASYAAKAAASSAANQKRMKPKVANLVPWPKGKRPPGPEDTAVSRARVRFEGPVFSSHKKMKHVASLAARLGG